MNEDIRQLRISIVGDGTTHWVSGKYSLLQTYSNDSFPMEYSPTILETATKTVIVDGLEWILSLVVTAGQEEYHGLRSITYEETDCFILCFAIDCHNSFSNVEDKWLPELRSHCPTAPIILAATKSDLRNVESLDCVSPRSVRKLKERIGAKALVECSAKTRENLDQVFVEAVRAVTREENKTCNIV